MLSSGGEGGLPPRLEVTASGPEFLHPRVLIVCLLQYIRILQSVGLCESTFLLLEYCIELFIGYSSTRLIPEVVVNYAVV